MPFRSTFSPASLAVLLFVTVTAAYSHAQLNHSQKEHLKHFAQAIDRIPAPQRSLLSAGTQNMYGLAKAVLSQKGAGGQGSALVEDPALKEHTFRSVQRSLAAPLAAGVTHVNDPNRDFKLSLIMGFTQSESSTAWCGDTVVVGYNDSGAYLRTLVLTGGAASFNGVASSVDSGRTFRSLDYLTPGHGSKGIPGGRSGGGVWLGTEFLLLLPVLDLRSKHHAAPERHYSEHLANQWRLVERAPACHREGWEPAYIG